MGEAASKAIQQVDQGSFSIAALEVSDLKEIIRDNLAPMGRVQCERVKMPSAGGLAFEVTDENGAPLPTAELVGILIDHYPVNAYWPDVFGGGSNPPACSALDGKVGVGEPGGPCAQCKFNQWGSDERTEGGRGKACKNLHRLYLLPLGDVLPLMIAAPPTSLSNIAGYMRLLTSKAKKPFYAVTTRIKLEKATNAGGIVYSRATFSRAGDIPADKVPALKAYIEELRPLLRSIEIVADDYNVENAEADSVNPQSQPF